MEVHADFDGWSVNHFENRYKKLRKKELAGMYAELRAIKHRNMWCPAKLKLGVLIILVTLTGCVARGPQTVARDAFDYSAAISKSRSDQMLLNIVRIRYMQVPNFLTVSSVIAGYTYQGNLGVSAHRRNNLRIRSRRSNTEITGFISRPQTISRSGHSLQPSCYSSCLPRVVAARHLF
jgi:hypothetical protein